MQRGHYHDSCKIAYTIDVSSNDGIDATSREIILGSARTLSKRPMSHEPREKQKRTRCLMRSYTLLSWYRSPVRGSVYGAFGTSSGVLKKRGVGWGTYVESGDVAVVSGREQRRGRFDRGVCACVCVKRHDQERDNVQVGTSSSPPRSPSTRLRSRSVRSRSRSWPRTVLRFFVRRFGFLAYVADLNGRGRWSRERCSASVSSYRQRVHTTPRDGRTGV